MVLSDVTSGELRDARTKRSNNHGNGADLRLVIQARTCEVRDPRRLWQTPAEPGWRDGDGMATLACCSEYQERFRVGLHQALAKVNALGGKSTH